MAFYNNENEDENKDTVQGMNNPQQNQSAQAPVQLSSQTAPTQNTGTTNNTNQNQAAPKSTKAASSGSAPGFQNYTKANQGNAQSSLNNSVTKNVANAGQSATNAINQASQQFSTRADQGALGGNQSRSTALSDVQGTVDSARNISADNGLDQSQQDRFKQVINSQYTGPESLRQAGLYDPASQKVQTSQNLIDNTKSATGREDLLRQIYQQRGDYSTGLNKLDSALLNSSQQGVQNLQNVAQAQGNMNQKLDQAQIGSANQAQNLTQEVRDIRQQSRDAFSTGKAAEEAATEQRLASVIEGWETLPEYFRDIIRNQSKGTTNLNSVEAALLGVNSGEGLYNLGANAIKSGIADKEKLISRDEQARQSALASLAGLDLSNQLDTNLLYGNAEKAGTQTAADALDLAATRAGLNSAEQNFRDVAEGTNIQGFGKGKASKGNALGKTTKKAETTLNANVADILGRSGYNLDSEIGQGNNIPQQQALLNALLKGAGNDTNASGTNMLGNMTSSAAQGAGAGAAIGSVVPVVGTGVGAALGGALGLGLGAYTGSGTIDPLQQYQVALDELGLGGLANVIQDGRNTAGEAYKDINQYNPMNMSADILSNALGLGSITDNIGSIIGGIDGKAVKNKAKAKANVNAEKNLKSNFSGFLDNQGFNNRIGVANNDATTGRLTALEQILANLDKTNT